MMEGMHVETINIGPSDALGPVESVLVVHCAGPGGKPAGEFVAAVGGHRNRVDPHHGHGSDHARPAGPSRLRR